MRLATGLAVCAVALAACGSPGPSATDRATVVASTNVYGSIATAVAGGRAEVTSLITDPAADPHSYESTPADALRVGRARVVVLNGAGYDPFMGRLVEAVGGQHAVVDVAEVAAAAGTAHALGESGEPNEHLWYSLPTVRLITDRLAADLGAADPGAAPTYATNARDLDGALDGLTRKVEAIAAAHRGTRVAVTEPLPGYLIEQAGLVDATPTEFSEAVEEDTDPPPAVVQQTLALFTGPQKVRALIVNAQTQTPVTDQVRRAAEAAGVPVVEMTETLPAGVGDYVSWMGAQIDSLAAALDRGPTP